MRLRLSGKMEFPRPTPQLALGVVILWALSLVLLDYGARLRAMVPIPVAHHPALCQLHKAPPPTASTVVPAGTLLLVRSTEPRGEAVCVRVELPDGRSGYLPWHGKYLRGDGFYVRLGTGS